MVIISRADPPLPSSCRAVITAITPEMEIQQNSVEEDDELVRAPDKSVADSLLKEHTVQISTVLNLPSLLPYLIQHDCLYDEDIDLFPKSETRKSNNLKFKRIVQEKGVSGFNSFLRALNHFVQDERGEGAHQELLQSLQLGLKRHYYRRKSSNASSSCQSTGPPSSIAAGNYSITEPLIEEQTIETAGDEEGVNERDLAQPQIVHHQPSTRESVVEVTQEDNTTLQPETPTQTKKYTDIPEFKYFIRCSVIFMCIGSPVYFIGGWVLFALSISAFMKGESCKEIVSAHSLTVFIMLSGFVCLTIPTLLALLVIYYCCEDRNKVWQKEFRYISSKCLVVGTTIVIFLTLFILIIIDLLYSLVYVAPQVYSLYGQWNDTQCNREVFLTAFWVLNFSSGLVVTLVAILGVYLSILYFRWVTDPRKPGTLRGLILIVFPTTNRTNSPSTPAPPPPL